MFPTTSCTIKQTIDRSEFNTLVVFDSRVSDIDTLAQGLLPGAIGFTIDEKDDGLAEITKLLAKTSAKYLAIVAHGEAGVVQLGRNPLNIQQLRSQSHQLSQWDVAEIALYSCEVANGDRGQNLIYQLSELTGAAVAASAKKVGSAVLGGNWDLTVTTGEVVTQIPFAAEILQTYPGILPANDFLPKTDFPVGFAPTDIKVGDFNGDGKLDLVTTALGKLNFFSTAFLGQTSVLLGDGVGGFSPKTFIDGPSLSVAVGDFNGDGKLDLASDSTGNNVSVRLGDGTGGFSPKTTFAVGVNPTDVAVGDFNGDGKLDLVTVSDNFYPSNSSSNTVSVLLGNGAGGFSPKTTFAVGINPHSVSVGDFNSDGKLDLVTTNLDTSTVSVLLGDGVGGFGSKTDFAVGSNPWSATVGDFNRDGKLDIVVVNNKSNTVSVLLGTGNGSFNPKTDFAVTAGLWVKSADFNGDGNLDLAVVNNDSTASDNTVSVLLGTGTGSFGVATKFVVANGAEYIAVGDFNSDGKPDLAVAGGTVSVLLNNFSSASSSTRNDFNGDGKSDILWRNNDGSVALWQMNGLTATPSSIGALPAGWTTAGTGDFSGDGKADLLLSNTDGRVATWQMDGSTVTKSTTIGTLTAGWSIAGTGDLNGDGTADVILTNTNGAIAEWEINNGTATAKTIGTLTDGWSIAGSADFNGDGKADLLFKNTDGRIAEWQMNGSTVLSAQVIGAITPDWSISATGDFNGDGKADILFRNTNGSVAEWQMNGATVTSTSIIGSAATDWNVAGTGDYNGDGKADILWRNTISGNVAEWQMNGSNVLSAGLTSISTAASSWNIAA